MPADDKQLSLTPQTNQQAAPPLPPPPALPAIPEGRRFGDHGAARKALYTNALQAVASLPVIENTRYKLHIDDLSYGGKDTLSKAEEKDAMLRDQTLARRLSGTIKLIDKATGNVVDQRRTTLAHVPHLTDRGVFIVDGNQAVLSSQLRLDPGVYVRQKSSGETEAHMNFMPGKGVSHRVRLDPGSGIFRVDVAQAQIPIAPLLTAMGVTRAEMEAAWGKQLADINIKAGKQQHLDRLWERLGRRGGVQPTNAEEKARMLAETVGAFELDPWVTNRTLGAPHSKANKDVYMAATTKVLKVAKREAEQDDRDSLAYSSLWAPEHLVADRLSRSAPHLAKALWQATNIGRLDKIPPGVLNPAIKSLFLSSGLAQGPDGPHATEFIDHGARLTKVGEGGIGRSADAVPMSAREVSASHLGFIDPAKVTESEGVGLDLRIAFGTRAGNDKRLYAPFRDARTGKIVYRNSRHIAEAVVAFPGALKSGNPVVPALDRGNMVYVPRDKVDYELPSMEQAFSPLSNLVPLKSGVKPQRASMGARMTGQALPLTEPEARYVRSGVPGAKGLSFDELYGRHMGPIFAPKDKGGVVTEVTPQFIKVKYDDGTTDQHELWDNLPAGRKVSLNSVPIVQPGDKFAPGQILAHSNMTDRNGVAAYGKNLRIAYMPYHSPDGAITYEDSIIVSKSVAENKLKSMHHFIEEVRHDDATIPGKAAYLSAFSGRFPAATLKHYDNDGAPKVGHTVNSGDPLILSVRRRQDGYGVAKSTKSQLIDSAVTWDHDEPGIVTDVVKTPHGIRVAVKTEKPLKDGDKMCYSADTMVYTLDGWKYIGEVLHTDLCATLIPNTKTVEFLQPAAIHRYPHIGSAYASAAGNLIVTPNHSMYVCWRGEMEFRLSTADSLGDKLYEFAALPLPDGAGTDEPAPTRLFGRLEHINYDGDVYCLSMPKNHTLFVKRGDGVPVWCGNSNTYGGKGVVQIVPDEHMPVAEDGRPVEVVLSSLGLTSRINPAQKVEAALGKVVEKTGKPYVLHDFEDIKDLSNFARRELMKHGIKAKETMTDPVSGRKIPNVATGVAYLMKLHHLSENKVAGRGLGAYDEAGMPLRGATGKAMRMSMGDTNAILGHGALQVLADLKNYRGQDNPAFWAAYMAGVPPTPPAVNAPYERFLNMLKGAGVHPVREGQRVRLKALKQSDIDELAGQRIIRSADTVDLAKGGRPVRGGLFDEAIGDNHWSKIPLGEKHLNPVMEDPARRLLGLTEQGFRDVIAGKAKLGDETGMSAIYNRLSKIDVAKSIAEARKDIDSNRRTKRDEAIRKLYYLKGCETTGVHPKDWFWTDLPVLPPTFRPIRPTADGRSALVHDTNILYGDVINLTHAIKDLSPKVSDLGDEKLALYDAVKAAVGLGDPVSTKNAAKGLRGVLGDVFGSGSSKTSLVQQKLLGSPADLSGRGVILPNPNLSMDEIGIPKEMAWSTFQPFVVRRLVQRGVPRLEALRMVEQRTERAQQALQDEMANRLVTATRYPSLHKYNTMAFKPKLVPGSSIMASPLVTKTYGADFDGNCCDFDEIVKLVLHKSELEATVAGRQFLSLLSERVVGTISSQSAIMRCVDVDTAAVEIKIGEFPRCGSGQTVSDKQEIYNVPVGVTVLTYDPVAGGAVYAPVEKLTIDKEHEVVEVVTARGRTVKVSNNASMAAYNSEADELQQAVPAVGQLVPAIIKEPVTGSKYDRDIGWWYGMFISDGWNSDDKVIGLAKLEQVKRDEFVRIARVKINDNFVVNTYTESAKPGTAKLGDSVKIHLYGKDLAGALFNCYYAKPEAGQRSALYKCIPAELMNEGSLECLYGLLSGLIDGDGTLTFNGATKNKRFVARFSTSSPYLCDDVVRLCRKLGIRTTVTTVPPRNHSNTAYVVSFSVCDMYKIANKLSVIGANETSVLSKFKLMSTPKDDTDLVPFSSSLRKRLLGERVFSYAGETKPLYDAIVKAKCGYMTRTMAARLLSALPDTYSQDANVVQFALRVADTSVTWDIVKEVNNVGTKDVFDLTVPQTKVFATGSGLVIWDTMSVHVILSDAANKDARDKMLPSKNLFSTASMSSPNFMSNMESVAGLHYLSTADNKNEPRVFRTRADAVAAYRRGEIDAGTRVKIVG